MNADIRKTERDTGLLYYVYERVKTLNTHGMVSSK